MLSKTGRERNPILDKSDLEREVDIEQGRLHHHSERHALGRHLAEESRAAVGRGRAPGRDEGEGCAAEFNDKQVGVAGWVRVLWTSSRGRALL
jgi:hypothetical protein